MSTSFISASMNTDFVHMSTNYQFTGCQISGISTENISLSSGRCKNLSARRDIRIATPSSSSLPSSTTPSTSCFRSFSSPTDASFASSSWDAATVHMGTNHQLTGSHIRGISTANISLSSRRKLSSDQERPQNEADPSPVPSSTVESEKARLRRASQERDRAQAEIQSNRSRSLSTHVYPTPQTSLERGIHANISLTYCARNAAPCKQVSGRSSFWNKSTYRTVQIEDGNRLYSFCYPFSSFSHSPTYLYQRYFATWASGRSSWMANSPQTYGFWRAFRPSKGRSGMYPLTRQTRDYCPPFLSD